MAQRAKNIDKWIFYEDMKNVAFSKGCNLGIILERFSAGVCCDADRNPL